MRKRLVGVALLGLLPAYSSATDYPIEFSDFFEKQPADVVVRLAGDPVGLRVNAQVSYDDFLLPKTQVTQLERYLTDKGLSDSAVDAIADALTQGVPANPGCKEALATCAPTVSGKDIQYVFDYDSGNLAIFVGSTWLARAANDEVAYHPAFRVDNALINQARLYSYADQTTNGGINASNLTTLGLPYGYLRFNTQYQSTNGDFEVYKGVYDLEVSGVRAVAGYTERDKSAFNTTDFLNDDAEYTSYALQFGSSRNLVRGGGENLQSVYLFAPQAGQLEIYQGDRLLLTRVVTEGRQDIAYSDLPTGVYDVRVVLRAGGQVVLDEPRHIVNSQQFSLPVGSWDYVLTAGRFEDVPEQQDLVWLNSPEAFSRNYAQSRLSWRVAENLLLAGALTSNQDDLYGQLGVNYAWSDWLEASYMFGMFSSEDRYQNATLRLGPVFLSANRFDSEDSIRAYRLASQLYDEQSYRRFSAMYSAPLLGGNGYVTYTHYNSDAPYSQSEVDTTSVDDVTAGWMRPWLGGQWGINTSYSDNENYNDFRVGLTVSYSLGDDVTTQFAVTADKSGLSRTEGSITKSMTHGNWSGSGTAGLAWQNDADPEEEATLSAMVNGHTDWFNAGAYGSIGNADRNMVSATLTGTQYISSQGAGLTNELGSSFIHVTPEVFGDELQANDISLDGVNYNVRQGSRLTYQGSLADGETVIPLTPYTDTQFVIDTESRNLRIDNNARREFVYPGTMYTVDAKVTPMVMQLYVLNDIHGKPIKQARCVGDACAGVEPLSEDGVFRVKYRAGSDYRLVSANLLCINEPGLSRDGAIQTACLPGLMSDEGRIAFESGGSPDASDLLYLGKYESSKEASDIISKLEEAKLVVQSVQVGQGLYLYVKNTKAFTLAQRSLLEGLEAYIVLNDASVDKLLTAR
ncbi:TcfC E-set like domain-containing protein [Aeromonas caviae]|uniref:TcfC E-set like domain-containing protein n=1 Tax=Aeromonas caviae TaxID=648 RepID=UPI0038D088CB